LLAHLALGSAGKLDLASSGLFSACLHPAVSMIKQTSPASPSLPDEKPLALEPTTELSDRAFVSRVQQMSYHAWSVVHYRSFWGNFSFFLSRGRLISLVNIGSQHCIYPLLDR
jgi:hypothetical protein